MRQICFKKCLVIKKTGPILRKTGPVRKKTVPVRKKTVRFLKRPHKVNLYTKKPLLVSDQKEYVKLGIPDMIPEKKRLNG